jgi:hypothetical protein
MPKERINMDKPDKTEERLTLHDGVILHLFRHSYNTVSFQKTHDFKIEYWYLTYELGFNNDPLMQNDPLEPFIDLSIGNERELELHVGRDLWDKLIKNGWKRSTQEQIDQIQSPPVLAVDGAIVSADWSDSITIGNYSASTVSISDDGNVTVTDSDGNSNDVNVLELKKELDKLKKEVQSLKRKKRTRRVK